MSNHNLRYYALAGGIGLTALGWILDKLPVEIGTGVILAVIGIASADMIKHRNDTK